MKDVTISKDIIYIGTDDKDIDLFESQYIVPNGVSYNSYIIIDEKIAIMDTVDTRKTDEWLSNLEKALNGRTPDYLVISHLEPDHAGNIGTVVEKYPDIKLVGNSKIFAYLPQFFNIEDLKSRKVEVKEGDVLDLGIHKLHFIMAPMVHWPEVMMEYEETEKILDDAVLSGEQGTEIEIIEKLILDLNNNNIGNNYSDREKNYILKKLNHQKACNKLQE